MVLRFPLPSLLCLLSFLEGDDVGEPYEQHDFMLPISERSRDITTFYADEMNLMRYKTCPQGLSLVPNWAQNCSDHVCSHAYKVLGYIDDFLLRAMNLEMFQYNV